MLSSNDQGNSCWCKTLAIIAPESSTASGFQTYMQSEYTALKDYYSAMGQSFTDPWFEPGYNGNSDNNWIECPSTNTDPIFRVFESEAALATLIQAGDYGYVDPNRNAGSTGTDRICGAVVFGKDALVVENPDIQLRFNVTWNPGTRYWSFLTKIDLSDDTRGLNRVAGQNSARQWYMVQGFVGMQILVQRFMKLAHASLSSSVLSGSQLDSTVELTEWQIFPFPGYEYAFNTALEALVNFQFILLFCFATSVALTIGRIVREREQKLREYMRVMGLFDVSYYFSWIFVMVIIWLLIALGVSAMSMLYAFKGSSFVVVFLFNFLFGLAAMSFSFFISSLCTRERLGSIVGFFAFFLLQWAQPPNYSSDLIYNACSLLPPSAYVMGVRTMFALQSQGRGISLDTLKTKMYGYSLQQAMIMLAVDVVFWWLVYYYIDQVNPFLFGAKRPWYFMFTRNFWQDIFGIAHVRTRAASTDAVFAAIDAKNPKFEKITDPGLRRLEAESKCIKTVNLTKKFGSNFYAVNNLSLTMYANEIYCLLGHNGAGKTTTFSMLSGMLDQTSGKISAFGMDIPKDLTEVRTSMGVCPQHSALWDEISVIEHMYIFSGIRGLDWNIVRKSIHSLIADIGLSKRAGFQVQALSGGMKRKLSVGISFIGDPKIVFLDEPTSGMDPYARRSTWDLLKKKRSEGRVICLTTHYMDEADVLGDRIAIMSHGKLECVGSPMFLKKLYGCGYLLTLVKADPADDGKRILELVYHYIPSNEVKVMSSIGREMILEVDDRDTAAFSGLIEKLDDTKIRADSGVVSYGISVSNIEEVFLKVAESSHQSKNPVPVSRGIVPPPPPSVTFWQQLKALLLRRVYYGLRDKQFFIMQLLLPFLILLIGLGLMTASVGTAVPAKTLTTSALNPDATNFNIIQSTYSGLLDGYCSAGGVSGSSTQCTELANPLLATAGTPYSVQQSLYDSGDDWNVTNSDPFFGFGGVIDQPVGTTNSWGLPLRFFGLWQNSTGLHTAPLVALTQFNAWAQAAGNVQLTITNNPLPNTAWYDQTVDNIQGTLAGLMIVLALSFIPTGIISFVVMEKEKEVKNQLLISGVNVKAYWLSNFIFDSLVAGVSTLVALIVFGIYSLSMFTDPKTIGGTFALLLLYGPASAAFAHVVSFVFQRQFAAQSFMAVASLIIGNVLVLVSYILQIIPEETCSSCMSIGSDIMWAGRVFPPFALGSGFYRLANYVYPMTMPLTSSVIFGGCVESAMSWTGEMECVAGIGDDLFFLGVMAIVYLLIAIGIDQLGSIPALRNMFVEKGTKKQMAELALPDPTIEDDAVIAEKQRVERLDKNSQLLYVNKICKIFTQAGKGFCARRSKVFAVQSISFASNKGEVFGLLGNNGAGKTTTFKMLCGLYCPSGGEIYVNGHNAEREMSSVRRIVGYCAQFDALWDLLTTKEHIELYAKIRGYEGAQLDDVVKTKLEELDLVEYADKRAGSLSGGNKRKLSVAMALIGEPQLVFLDEPSCGMDPFARRSMWKIIQNISDNRKQSLIILTTHSMEEAEALCSRLAIQVDGRFRCLGTSQEIKSKYGEGFEINFKVPTPDVCPSIEEILKSWNQVIDGASAQRSVTLENCKQIAEKDRASNRPARVLDPAFGIQPFLSTENTVSLIDFSHWIYNDNIFAKLIDFINSRFPTATYHVELIELHGLNMKIKISPSLKEREMVLKLGQLFKTFNEAKDAKLVDDYQVSQTTLEQIFNKFASNTGSSNNM
jgi:ATP-binding cassette, subfamily A (ABC1), member 3